MRRQIFRANGGKYASRCAAKPLGGNITIYEETYNMQFMMNGQGELIPDESMTEEEKEDAMMMFETHKDEIRDILRTASDLWGDELN